MTADEFKVRFAEMEPRQTLAYHRGILSRDCDRHTGPENHEDIADLRDIARQYGTPPNCAIRRFSNAFRETAGRGLGHLTQKRAGPDFEYRITKI